MSKTREDEILKALYLKRSMTVKELAETIYSSETSVRRDLAKLEEKGLLKRFHGGATLGRNGVTAMKNPYTVRELVYADEKIKIARKAASFVNENCVIFLDSSTSCYNMLPFLKDKKNVTVITNSVKLQYEVPQDCSLRIISTGGTLTPIHYALHGEEALNTISRYYTQLCFISCGGFDCKGNASSLFKEENQIRRAMMANSNHTYLLCTSNKIDIRKSYHICTSEELDGIICTKPLNAAGADKQILVAEDE